MVATMDRVRLDRFTRETWRKFDEKDLEPLKWAIILRCAVGCAVRPQATRARAMKVQLSTPEHALRGGE
jgi:hypothetical protein